MRDDARKVALQGLPVAHVGCAEFAGSLNAAASFETTDG
jgi:hypothetical protein